MHALKLLISRFQSALIVLSLSMMHDDFLKQKLRGFGIKTDEIFTSVIPVVQS